MVRKFLIKTSFTLLAASLGGSVLNASQPSQEISSQVGVPVTAASPEQRIAAYVKRTIQDWSAEGAVKLMKGHYARLGMIDQQDRWAAPELEAISDILLPQDLDREKIYAFIDIMANNVATNGYLHGFLLEAQDQEFPVFMAKMEADKQRVLPDMIAYAVVLDRLTKAMRDDYTLISTCEACYKRARNEVNIWKHMDAFQFAKLFSIEYPANKFVEFHQSGKIPTDFGRNLAPLNVAEACLEDVKKDHVGNARAGWSLIVNRPGDNADNYKTGAGPTHWSEDGKAVEFAPPLALQWDDLYITWNLAFMAQRNYGPYSLMKLLMPQLSSYRDHPQEFMYNRVISLYTHINWAFIRQAEDAKSGRPAEEWADEKLLALWGRFNRDSAHNYDDALVAADPTWINWLNDLDSKFHKLKPHD